MFMNILIMTVVIFFMLLAVIILAPVCLVIGIAIAENLIAKEEKE
jgi:hypothetical protein